jgi:hypothetical protein
MKFLADENFDNRVVRGLMLRQLNLDIIRVQDLEIAGAFVTINSRFRPTNGALSITRSVHSIICVSITGIMLSAQGAGTLKPRFLTRDGS